MAHFQVLARRSLCARTSYCKHIHAAGAHAIPRNSGAGTIATVLNLIYDGVRPRCRTAVRRDGVRRNGCGDKQRYRCTGCGLAVLDGIRVLVAEVPDTYTAGMSLRRIAWNIGQRIKDSRKSGPHRIMPGRTQDHDSVCARFRRV